MLGEKIACATVSHFLYIAIYTQAQCCYQQIRQQHSDLGDFDHGVCHVMKFTVAESYPETFCCSSHVLGRVNKMPILIMSFADDRGYDSNEQGNR